MDKTFLYSEIAGAVLVMLVGSLLHFVYGWSGRNPAVGLAAPVNESTWEHLKLLFFPALLYTAVQALFGPVPDNFLIAKALGITAGLLAIPLLFYTYSGIVGRNFLAADILTFLIGVAAAYGVSYGIASSGRLSGEGWRMAGAALLAVWLVSFLVFTRFPPRIGLFRDPVGGGYGITNEKNEFST